MKYANTTIPSQTPTVSASSAYTSGDVVGSAMQFSRAFGGEGRTGVVKTVLVLDKGNQKAPLTLLFFNAQPGTVAADNAAFSFASADVDLCVGKVNVAAADYETVGGKAVAAVDVSAVLQGTIGTLGARDCGDLWVVAVTTGTPTYASTSDLTFRLGLLAD